MTSTETFNPNFRLLRKEANPVPEDAPDDFAPPRYRTVTRGAILAAYPHLGYLADPSQPAREATEYEAAVYEARRSDPEWADLYRLVAEGDAFAARVRVLAGPEPLLPAPVAADPESGPIVITREELTQVWDEQHPAEPAPVAAAPEAAGDPAQPGEDVSPQPPEAPEPAPDATQVLNPGEAMTALLPPLEAPTALLPAVQDEEGQP